MDDLPGGVEGQRPLLCFLIAKHSVKDGLRFLESEVVSVFARARDGLCFVTAVLLLFPLAIGLRPTLTQIMKRAKMFWCPQCHPFLPPCASLGAPSLLPAVICAQLLSLSPSSMSTHPNPGGMQTSVIIPLCAMEA